MSFLSHLFFQQLSISVSHRFQWQFMRFTIERGKYNFLFILITARTSGKSSIKCLLWCNLQFRLHSWPTFVERSTDIGVNLFMAMFVAVAVIVDVAMTCRQHLRPLEIASRCQMRRQTAAATTTQHKEATTRKRSNTFRFPLSVCNFGLLFLCWLCTLHTHTHTNTHTRTQSQQKKATTKTTTTRE